MFMIGVRCLYSCLNALHIVLVRRISFDIICETEFGLKIDSLHNPENELAVAYERLLRLQDGRFIEIVRPGPLLMLHPAWKVIKLTLLLLIPGVSKLLTTSWMYKCCHWFDNIPFIGS